MEVVPVIALILVMVFSPEEPANVSTPSQPKIVESTNHSVPITQTLPAVTGDDLLKNDAFESEFSDQLDHDSVGVTDNVHDEPRDVLSFKQLSDEDYEKEQANLLRFIRKTYRKISDSQAMSITKALLETGQETGLDPKFAAALIARESSFNAKAVSVTGAKGLGQIKDFNFKSLRIKNPFDVQQNVRGTVTYLKEMMSSWKGRDNQKSLALASYFRGVNRIRRANGEIDSRAQKYADDILLKYDELVQGLDSN